MSGYVNFGAQLYLFSLFTQSQKAKESTTQSAGPKRPPSKKCGKKRRANKDSEGELTEETETEEEGEVCLVTWVQQVLRK